jgi:hypothetical protein
VPTVIPINTLTDALCRAAKAQDKPRKLFDGHGMYLYVTPAGSKTWRMAYRADSKPQTATLGQYPLLSLSAARAKRDQLRRQLVLGEEIERIRKPRNVMTLSRAIDEYWADLAWHADSCVRAVRDASMRDFIEVGSPPCVARLSLFGPLAASFECSGCKLGVGMTMLAAFTSPDRGWINQGVHGVVRCLNPGPSCDEISACRVNGRLM